MKQDFRIFLDFSRRLWTNRFMLKMMTDRELKAQYVGSLFGLAWAVINPLALMAVYGIVFGYFFKTKPDPSSGTQSYMLYLVCGLIPWQFFAQTVTSCADALTKNSNLIKKAVDFPSEILPVVTVFSSVISHLIGVAVLLILTVIFNGSLSPWTLVIFVYIFFIVVLTVGLGWILSSLSVYLKDLKQVLGLVIMAGFFFTPIFYPASRIPAAVLWIFKLNPMFHVVEGYRLTMLAGRPPVVNGLIYLAVVSVVTFAMGGIFFRRLKPGFAEVL
ncbi:MAG: ABC transporter permease [Deltaproteobacteria bacterium]|nr:ABC transporter permease [Deltaproteobacteria bacterium]